MSGAKATIATARHLLAACAAAATLVTTHGAAAHWPSVPLATVEIYDRTSGATLDVHVKDGQRYVVGTPGHEYAVRIRNRTGARILAVASVDGVNVVTGETASPAQSGYVMDAGGRVDIEGWRTSLERTSAFYFTDLDASYAARTGRPANVGVIGVAVFRERPVPMAERAPRDKVAAADEPSPQRAERAAAAAPPENTAKQSAASPSADGAVASESRKAASALGTGYGRSEASFAQRVRFERASDQPEETIAIRYDRRENLIAMGVLPPPTYAQRAPDPFPAMQFVPPPR